MDYKSILTEALRRRDGNICCLCREPFYEHSSVHFDHILPRSKGGEDALYNLQLTHARCNIRAGAKGGSLEDKFPASLVHSFKPVRAAGIFSRQEIKAKIEQVLAEVGGNKPRAAEIMGMSLRTLYRRLEE